jgi:hypothetical protein
MSTQVLTASHRRTSVLLSWTLFVCVGLLIYVFTYAAADWLIYRYGKENRFYVVRTAPRHDYDYLILGASHAAVFSYRDMNARLEALTQSRILNVSVVGGGITINRLLFDYFLASHHTANVVYVVDSFAFYARTWNEDRLEDVRLFNRAPFDPTLVRIMLRNPATRSAGFQYLVGFSKINNADRFEPDVNSEQSRFERTYRPVAQIDRQRLAYLYPASGEQQRENLTRYLSEFEDLVRDAKSKGIKVIAIKPPIPERIYRLMPDEAGFDATLRGALARHGVELYDFSRAGNDDKYFFDTDHLNRGGVLNFFQMCLAPVLVKP